MGKRSNFERVERDYYPTPYEAVIPLLPHLQPKVYFFEPCAGDGRLANHLHKHGHICHVMSDIYPMGESVIKQCAFEATPPPITDYTITNPPWCRKFLHSFIDKYRMYGHGCWLLFDSDWWDTKQAIPFKKHCKKTVTVGRVKWIEGSKSTGKDNCTWYLFDKDEHEYAMRF